MKSNIKTFEDAFRALGVDPKVLLVFLGLPEADQKKAIADYKMDKIVAALNNEGLDVPWVPDYSDWNQRKYIPYFKFSASSGWSFRGYDYWCTSTGCGSRRDFRTEEIAEYAATQFIDVYSDILG